MQAPIFTPSRPRPASRGVPRFFPVPRPSSSVLFLPFLSEIVRDGFREYSSPGERDHRDQQGRAECRATPSPVRPSFHARSPGDPVGRLPREIIRAPDGATLRVRSSYRKSRRAAILVRQLSQVFRHKENGRPLPEENTVMGSRYRKKSILLPTKGNDPATGSRRQNSGKKEWMGVARGLARIFPLFLERSFPAYPSSNGQAGRP